MSILLFLDEVVDLLVQFFYDGLVFLLLVVEDFGVLEVFDQAVDSLKSCVGQVANLKLKEVYLFGSEAPPFLAMELFVESFDRPQVGKVNESVALIRATLGVVRQVQKVIIIPKILVNLLR